MRRLKTCSTRLVGSVCYQYREICFSFKGQGLRHGRCEGSAALRQLSAGSRSPRCLSSAACQACAECRRGAAVQVASTLWPLAAPSSRLVAVRRCWWPTRSQQITGQRGARAVFGGCPAFCGHMACSPQMGNHLSIKRFGLIS